MSFKEAVNCQDYIASVIDERMNVEHWWNNADKVKPKYREINLPQHHFVRVCA
jgi:hypothetical protein